MSCSILFDTADERLVAERRAPPECFGCGSFGRRDSRCQSLVRVVTEALLASVEGEVVVKMSIHAQRPRRRKIASAPCRLERAPVTSIRCLTRWRQAPSMTPVAIGQPLRSSCA